MQWPVDASKYVSNNPFGQYDPQYYPKTKHHVGSDFAVPVGTTIKAPCEGEVLKVTYNAARGNTAIFDFFHAGREWGLELCHLRELPPLGKFKEGAVIAQSGNTGSATTGAHLHMVLHKDCMVTKNYSELTSEEAFVRLWREGRLVDPYLYFFQNCK